MANAVFVTRVNPEYDDLPEERYHFPRTYLKQVREAVNDWVLYYEPRRGGGRLAYFATARVVRIESDSIRENHFYAIMSDYVEFANPVPFKIGDQYFESGLKRPDGKVNLGLFQRAVHLLPFQEYMKIVKFGLASTADFLMKDESAQSLVAEPMEDYGRPLIASVVSRPHRDKAFQQIIRQAYDSTCAITGLKLINGGGRCEIEAAHIKPVKEHGPDSPRNGIALSRTFHWMFDRGLISVDNDGKILTAKKLVPTDIKKMMKPDGFINWPENKLWRPHPQFLNFHRENIFRG
jgi:putative restriction endonuclease